MKEDHANVRDQSAIIAAAGIVRILIASFILAKAVSLYIGPNYTGSLADISLFTILILIGFSVMFAFNPSKLIKALMQPKDPVPIVRTVEPTMIADPIVRRAKTPSATVDWDTSIAFTDYEDCDVINIFVEQPTRPRMQLSTA